MVYAVQEAPLEAPLKPVGTSAQFLSTFIRLQYQLDEHRFVLRHNDGERFIPSLKLFIGPEGLS